MENINWNYPTPIWFGLNRVKDIESACNNLNIKKPLIVTDPGILKTNKLNIRNYKSNKINNIYITHNKDNTFKKKSCLHT